MGIYFLIMMWLIFCSVLFHNEYMRNVCPKGVILKWKWKYCLIASLPILFIMIFRAYNIGNDTIIYIRHFRYIQQYSFAEILAGESAVMGRTTMEMGYLLFEKLLSIICQEDIFYMVVVNVILIVSVTRFIVRYSENPGLSLYLFFTIGLFSFMVTGIRQSIAICIGLYALEQAQERNAIKFICLVLLAMTFHKSAIVLAIIYFLVNQRLTILNSFIIFLVSMLGILFFKPLHEFFNERMGYEYEIEETGNGQIFLFIMIILLVLNLWQYKKNILQNEKMKVLYNMQIVCTLLWILRLISRTAERPSYYFMFSIIVIIPNTINRCVKRSNRILLVMMLMVLLGVLFVYRTIGNPLLSPYRFIWSS